MVARNTWGARVGAALVAYAFVIALAPARPVAAFPVPSPVAAAPATAAAGATVYLPNVTRMLGGPDGWQTPFIVQNIGNTDTDLEISFYGFSDGSLVTQRHVSALRPGTSFADVPNNDTDLPANGQFAVVIVSTAAPVVSVVNEHQGTGDRAEALSYTGISSGAAKVSLPYVAKDLDGWLTTFIIQNVGTAPAYVDVALMKTPVQLVNGVPVPSLHLTRRIEPGRSGFVDPRGEPSIGAGQYAATITADQPIAVVTNVHNDAPGVAAPRAYSYNGIADPGTKSFVPYLARNIDKIGRSSTLHVQNAGNKEAKPDLQFNRLGETVRLDIPDFRATTNDPIPPGAVASIDFGAENNFLDNMQTYTVTITGGTFAVLNATLTSGTALGFTAVSHPSAKLYLPNVTRQLGGFRGWTTPFFVQSAGASGATVRWYRFSDGRLVYTQTLGPFYDGRGVRVDPASIPQLSNDPQYAVVIESTSAPLGLAAIVLEYAEGGDSAMAYEAFIGSPSPLP